MLLNSVRERSSEETLKIILPYAKKAGITRLADLTHLDQASIPVYTAIRPMSKSLTTSQGKSENPIDAIVGAYMESLEVYFAENVLPEIQDKAFSGEPLFIDPNKLPSNVTYSDEYRHNWCKGQSFIDEQSYYIPMQFLSLDTTNREVLIQAVDTTGVASGNSYNEALVHSLLECIERKFCIRDAKALGVDGDFALLTELQKEHRVKLSYHANSYDVCVISCVIQSKYDYDSQMTFSGYGAHMNKEIALARALTEAMQSKVTTVAGSRDDLHKLVYTHQNRALEVTESEILFSEIKENKFTSVAECITHLKTALSKNKQDAFVYCYHQGGLVFLKSILLDCNILSEVQR